MPNIVVFPRYEKRVTAFMDILGFSDLIPVIEDRHASFEHVFLVVREMLDSKPKWKDKEIAEDMWETTKTEAARFGRTLSQKDHEKILDILAKRDRALAFSDNLVRSSPADWPGAVSVIYSVVLLSIRLLVRGTFVRGGITVGNLCHEDSLVFGPALIEAHRMEKKLAKYPRIVLSPSVLDLMRCEPPYGGCGAHLQQVFRVDDGGIAYLHFLSRNAMEDAGFTDNRRFEALSRIRSQLAGKIRFYPECSGRVQEKLRWFVHYFNDTIRSEGLLKQIPPLEDIPWD